jgi:hypothetical protein
VYICKRELSMKKESQSHNSLQKEALIIGHAVSLANPRLDLQCVGSPREVLEEIRVKALNPKAVFGDAETEISVAEVYKEGPEIIFTGGPNAETLINLIEAIKKNKSEEVKCMLHGTEGQTFLKQPEASGVLTAAVVSGSEEIVKLLLSRGADPNGTTQFDMTALHWAAALGKTETAIVLLDAGADAERLTWFYAKPCELANLNRKKSTEQAMNNRLGCKGTVYNLKTIIERMTK